MTLTEAAAHVGCGVVYAAPDGTREDGTITAVSAAWVFVQYPGGTKATPAEALTLLGEEGPGHRDPVRGR